MPSYIKEYKALDTAQLNQAVANVQLNQGV